MTNKSSELTYLLNQENINPENWDHILPIVYKQLKVMAHNIKSNHKKDEFLNTTSLVHEAFIKIQKNNKLNIKGTKHFYHVAALAMRQIITDTARARLTAKRKGIESSLDGDQVIQLSDNKGSSINEILEIDKALNKLKKLSPRLSDIVTYHFFAGYSFIEVAELLDISESTVIRDWKKARAWLFASLK
ncbi:MAG: ECF-type sigma factor [Marinicellaceae bacterium]